MYKTKPELLAPAGGMECVKAAVQNGCSAVYVGAKEFSARRSAANFTLSELEEAADYCHVRGVKLYTAVNTLVQNTEIKRFLDLVESIYLIGADGVITQDIGCAIMIKKYFPDFYLSASTQMTVHDLKGAEFLFNHGFNRVVLSRELSASEIANICSGTKTDIECFIHGAVCVCYSGQCLMSAFNGGRSGNRGGCAQPCRLEYGLRLENKKLTEGGLLSPKDMMGLHALPTLINSGVKSFKIEGRMKSPEYVAGVTAIYRKYIDSYYENPQNYYVDDTDIERLAAIFNRSGFNKGYFYNYSGKSMMTDGNVGNTGVYIGETLAYENRKLTFRTLHELVPGDGVAINGQETGSYITKKHTPGETTEITLKTDVRIEKGTAIYRTFNKKLMDELRQSYAGNERRILIDGRFFAKVGERISLKVQFGEIEAEAFSDAPEMAQTNSATRESIEKQLLKTGNTTFIFEKLEIELGDNLFINVKKLNELRREALASLEGKITAYYKRKADKKEKFSANSYIKTMQKNNNSMELTVSVRNLEQLEAVMKYRFSRLYIDFEVGKSAVEEIRDKEVSVYRCLDRIERGDNIERSYKGVFDGVLIRTYGQAEFAKNYEYAVDYTLNTFNSLSAKFWAGEGCNTVCVSPELNICEQNSDINFEVVCYGKIPVMNTVQCPIGNFCDDKRNDKGGPFCKYKNKKTRASLSNGKKYDLLTVCEKCYCLVLSAKPISIKPDALYKYNRLEFSNENFVDVNHIMSIYAKYIP